MKLCKKCLMKMLCVKMLLEIPSLLDAEKAHETMKEYFKLSMTKPSERKKKTGAALLSKLTLLH